MRTVSRYLWLLCAFGLALGTIYWFLTREVTGAVLLWAFGLMPFIVALWLTRRGILGDPRPEDDPEGVPSSGSSQSVGSFPLMTAWPIFMVLGVITVGASLVYGLILLAPGVALFGYAVFGFVRESRG